MEEYLKSYNLSEDINRKISLLENKFNLLENLVHRLQQERKEFFAQLDKIVADRINESQLVRDIVNEQIEAAKSSQEQKIKEELSNIANMV